MTTPIPFGGTPAFTPARAAEVTVLVADGHPVTREGLKALLHAQPGLRVVGEAADGPAAVRLTLDLDPDVVVLDPSLPGMCGLELAARCRAGRPSRKVIVLTACEGDGPVRPFLGAGAAGYVLKQATTDQLLSAVLAVVAGGLYVDPAVARGLTEAPKLPDEMLSAREGQVLRMIALGYSNKEVAAKTELSVKTVETYKARAMEKLRMRSRVDIIRYANERGWLTDTLQDGTGE